MKGKKKMKEREHTYEEPENSEFVGISCKENNLGERKGRLKGR